METIETARLAEVRLLLALLSLPNIGRKRAIALRRMLGDIPILASDLFERLSQLDLTRTRIPTPTSEQVLAAFGKADRILDACSVLGISVAVRGDATIPESVWSIPDPPAALFLLGAQGALVDRAAVAIVGTREPSDFGARAARRFAQRGVEHDLVVVSGLALGCDTAAHRGALDARGTTVAVLGHGLHAVYPTSNTDLSKQICEQGGLLVSEYPPGIELHPTFLVERDRLQAALSRGLIVVETELKGGTMHTVRFAQEQRRPIACLVHAAAEARETQWRGNRQLLEQRIASPLASAAQLTAFLEKLKAAQGAGVPPPAPGTSQP